MILSSVDISLIYDTTVATVTNISETDTITYITSYDETKLEFNVDSETNSFTVRALTNENAIYERIRVQASSGDYILITIHTLVNVDFPTSDYFGNEKITATANNTTVEIINAPINTSVGTLSSFSGFWSDLTANEQNEQLLNQKQNNYTIGNINENHFISLGTNRKLLNRYLVYKNHMYTIPNLITIRNSSTGLDDIAKRIYPINRYLNVITNFDKTDILLQPMLYVVDSTQAVSSRYYKNVAINDLPTNNKIIGVSVIINTWNSSTNRYERNNYINILECYENFNKIIGSSGDGNYNQSRRTTNAYTLLNITNNESAYYSPNFYGYSYGCITSQSAYNRGSEYTHLTSDFFENDILNYSSFGYAQTLNYNKIIQYFDELNLFYTTVSTLPTTKISESNLPDNTFIGMLNEKGDFAERISNLSSSDKIGQLFAIIAKPLNEQTNREDKKETIDPNTYTDETPLKHVFNSSYNNNFNKMFLLNKSDVSDIADKFWGNQEDIIQNSQLMGENPLDTVISLRLYPFDLSEYSTGVALNYYCGNFEIGQYETLNTALSPVINLGSIYIPRYHNNFLDYDEYTDIELFVPFCESKVLSAREYLDSTLNFKMVIDYNTGNCLVMVYQNNILKFTCTGQCGIDIAINGRDNAQYLSNQITGWTNTVNSSINTVSTASQPPSPETALNIASGVTNVFKSSFENSHMRNAPITSGQTTQTLNLYKPLYPYIIFRYSEPLETELTNYGRTVGYACYYDSTLGTNRGFTVCNNIDISKLKCTAEEKTKILEFLTTGIIL